MKPVNLVYQDETPITEHDLIHTVRVKVSRNVVHTPNHDTIDDTIDSSYIDRNAGKKAKAQEPKADSRKRKASASTTRKSLNLSGGHNISRHTGMPRGPGIELHPSAEDAMIAPNQSYTNFPVHTSQETPMSHTSSTSSSNTNVTKEIHCLLI
jgi:hypothetical protein